MSDYLPVERCMQLTREGMRPTGFVAFSIWKEIDDGGYLLVENATAEQREDCYYVFAFTAEEAERWPALQQEHERVRERFYEAQEMMGTFDAIFAADRDGDKAAVLEGAASLALYAIEADEQNRGRVIIFYGPDEVAECDITIVPDDDGPSLN